MENRGLEERVQKLEQEKERIQQKWVKVSAAQRAESKNKDKMKEKLEQLEQTEKKAANQQKKLEILQRENQVLKEQVETKNRRDSNLQRQVQELERQVEGLEQEKQLADKCTQELLSRVNSQEEAIQELSGQLEQAERERTEAEEVKEMQREFCSLQEELNETNEQASRMSSYLRELEGDNEGLAVEVEKLRRKAQEKERENLEHSKCISSLRSELSDLQAQLCSSTKSNERKFLRAKCPQDQLEQARRFILDDEEPNASHLNPNASSSSLHESLEHIVVKAADKLRFSQKYIF
jgi:chromosome segregation ATPase